jgi:type I restriction enzyme S subunit
VIFGDHTRVLKYVDFDFVLGADGVKILEPTNNIDSKFLLYYLTWYNVPSLGYSRHYKLLKEISLPAPPPSNRLRGADRKDRGAKGVGKTRHCRNAVADRLHDG